MYYDKQTYLQLKELRKHRLFVYSMMLALALLLVNIVMDYLLTNHIPYNAVFTLFPVIALLLIKHFCSFNQAIYRSFYFLFIVITIYSIIEARPEQGTTTYWAFLLIITIFTYENVVKSAVVINITAFLCLCSLMVLDNFSYISLPYTQFNYLSF